MKFLRCQTYVVIGVKNQAFSIDELLHKITIWVSNFSDNIWHSWEALSCRENPSCSDNWSTAETLLWCQDKKSSLVWQFTDVGVTSTPDTSSSLLVFIQKVSVSFQLLEFSWVVRLPFWCLVDWDNIVKVHVVNWERKRSCNASQKQHENLHLYY